MGLESEKVFEGVDVTKAVVLVLEGTEVVVRELEVLLELVLVGRVRISLIVVEVKEVSSLLVVVPPLSPPLSPPPVPPPVPPPPLVSSVHLAWPSAS
jgi:hypothetical protein